MMWKLTQRSCFHGGGLFEKWALVSHRHQMCLHLLWHSSRLWEAYSEKLTIRLDKLQVHRADREKHCERARGTQVIVQIEHLLEKRQQSFLSRGFHSKESEVSRVELLAGMYKWAYPNSSTVGSRTKTLRAVLKAHKEKSEKITIRRFRLDGLKRILRCETQEPKFHSGDTYSESLMKNIAAMSISCKIGSETNFIALNPTAKVSSGK